VALSLWKNFARKNTGLENLNFAQESKDREVGLTWVIHTI
jgi:hypothetical protein